MQPDSARAHFWLSVGLVLAIVIVVWGPVLARVM